MKKKEHVFKILGIFLAVVTAVSVFLAGNTKETYASYINQDAGESRTYTNGWAAVSLAGPSGTCWVSLKFTYSGKQMTQDEFNDAPRTLTIEKSNQSTGNPYDLKLVTPSGSDVYTTKTALNDNNRYTSIYFEMQYKIPAHESAKEKDPETNEAPYDFKTEGRFVSTSTHKTSDRTVKVKIRISIYSIGICTFYGKDGIGSYTYNRYYDSQLHWYLEKKTHKLTYDKNGGEITYPSDYPKDGIFKDGEKYPIPSAERKGYDLTGWKSKDGSIVTSDKTICSDDTLTAQWKAKKYTIHYDANGGIGTMEDSEGVYDGTLTLPKNLFVRDGYVFMGWSSDKDAGKEEYLDGELISDLTGDNLTKSLYAVWKKSDGNFGTNHIIHDEGMFAGDINIEGENQTGYDNSHTDSEYARIDTKDAPGYFSKR